ncbi:MAG: hypothetical protein ACKOC0_04800 [Cytophagales bacterium]
MRTITFIVVALVAVTSYAQPSKRRGANPAREGKIAGQTIDASQVPDAVKNAFAATGVAAERWEKQEANGKHGKSFTKYVAVYTQGGMRVRARFREDGTALSTSKYMKADQLPASIKSAADAKAQGQQVMGGEEVKTKKGETFYRIFSRGGGSRTVSMFDAKGQPVTREKMSDDLKDLEGEEEGGGNQ